MKLKFTLEIDPKDLAEFLKALPVGAPIVVAPVTPSPEPIQEPVKVVPITEIPKPFPIKIEGDELDWNHLLKTQSSIILKSGKTYRVKNYKSHALTAPIHITKDGEENANIIFGEDGYSPWDGKPEQSRFLFDSPKMEHDVTFDGVNPYSAKPVNEIQPFFLTIFKNSPAKDQKGTYKLLNLETNCESGLLYSGQQEVQQYMISKNVKFKGMIWEEMKANNGGGLMVIKEDVDLTQIDPITHFEADLAFLDTKTVKSSVSFNRINNEFNSQGNSCNILFVSGMTFYLPNTKEFGEQRTIRPIPWEGEIIELTWTGQYLRTNQYSLQAGDLLSIGGKQYQIKVKDRIPGTDFEKSGYSIDFKLDQDLVLESGSIVSAKVIKSSGLNLIGKSNQGYMIFKYNHQFQTNLDIDHGLEYMLKSNPFGVLSYNHKEVTFDNENVIHNGFYRQSWSGVGFSNGYRMAGRCTGFKDEFNPPVPVITE